MNINPMQLIQMIKTGQNPQQLLMKILEERAAATPMGANLLEMVKQNRTNDLEVFTRNYLASQGKDLDEEYKRLMQALK